MVARNFSLQDLPYARLLQVSDEDREFLSLEELKPHQLTELSGACGNHGGGVGADSGLRGASINRGLSENIQIVEKQHSVVNIGGSCNNDGNGMISYGGSGGNTNSNGSGGGQGTTATTTTTTANQQVYYDLNTQQTTNGTSAMNPYQYVGGVGGTSSESNGWTQAIYHPQQQQQMMVLQQSHQMHQQQVHHNMHHHQSANSLDMNVQQQQLHNHHTQQGMGPGGNEGTGMSSGTGGGGAAVGAAAAAVASSNNLQTHQLHPLQAHTPAGSVTSTTRKRKNSFTETSDLDDDADNRSVRTSDESKKQNHSEIEKRRRDKMNTYITELSAMVPMCHAMSRKLDKLTVLRMAVQHLKTIRGAVHSYTEGHYKPAFLSDQELKTLILQAAEGFLFVIGCDRGRILYVSESVQQVLNYSQGDLLGQSWFDILHPKDIAKVKEQLSSLDLSRRERLIDAKTMLPVKTDIPQGLSRLCPGARRSFFCRMKCKNSVLIKEEQDGSTMNSGSSNGATSMSNGGGGGSTKEAKRKGKMNGDKRFCVIQCTGYLKSWAPAKMGLEEQEQEQEGDGESFNLSCLVAVGRIPPNVFAPPIPPPTAQPAGLRTIMFLSRHAMDGQFLFVDQRATLMVGFLPQELLTTNMYEYFHHDDIPALAEAHKSALQGMEKVTTIVYRMRVKDGSFIRVQSEWRGFKNPWTKDVEYLIAKNYVILSEPKPNEAADAENSMNNNSLDGEGQMNVNFEFFSQNNGRESMQRMINSHVEASKIGREIAEKVMEYHRRCGETSSESSPDPDGMELRVARNAMPFNGFRNVLSQNPMIGADPSAMQIGLEEPPPTMHRGNGLIGHHSQVSMPGDSQSSSGDNSDVTMTTDLPPRRNGITLPSYGLIRSDRTSHSESTSSSIEGAGMGGGGGGGNNNGDSGQSSVDGMQMMQNVLGLQEMAAGTAINQTDGNDEGAMAVIMSLLEADAGLGGPVDFTGLPWPLP